MHNTPTAYRRERNIKSSPHTNKKPGFAGFLVCSLCFLAEEEGFEPSKHVAVLTRFRVVRLQPDSATLPLEIF